MKKLTTAIVIAIMSSAVAQAPAKAPIGFRVQGDGRVILTGAGDLSGIVLKSAGNHLSFEEVEAVPGTGVMTTQRLPFFDTRLVGAEEITSVDGSANVATDLAVFKEDPNDVQYGVIGAGNRVRVQGQLATSVFHAAPMGGLTQQELAVDIDGSGLGVGDNPTREPASITCPQCVPEPASGMMVVAGLIGLLGFRRRR